jgi:hypothetical protein
MGQPLNQGRDMNKEIDAFRTAHLSGRGKSHLMYVDSEYTLCGRSTASDEASVWEVSIPREPQCDRCRLRMLDSEKHLMFKTDRHVMAYVWNGGVLEYRGAFSVRVGNSDRRKSEGWGMEHAAMSARYIVDLYRLESVRVEVLNPETLLYEEFEFESGEVRPVTD